MTFSMKKPLVHLLLEDHTAAVHAARNALKRETKAYRVAKALVVYVEAPTPLHRAKLEALWADFEATVPLNFSTEFAALRSDIAEVLKPSATQVA